ncbi:MAG: DUF4174 domain-containing protein [Pseudomonadota bacterium]
MKFLAASATLLAALATLPLAALAEGEVESAVDAWRDAPDTIFNAADVDLSEFQWVARPIIVFADSPLDPAFQTQMDNLTSEIDDVIERDIVIITDTAPREESAIRIEFRPRGFQMVLLGKDGGRVLRKPFPYDMREISRSVDKQPIRQREISENRGS